MEEEGVVQLVVKSGRLCSDWGFVNVTGTECLKEGARLSGVGYFWRVTLISGNFSCHALFSPVLLYLMFKFFVVTGSII